MSFFAPLSDTSSYVVKIAKTLAEQKAAYAIRRSVFCDEQSVFAGDDRDAVDDIASTIVALNPDGVVVGTVRIHEASPRLWWGSRLAVDRKYRRVAQLGAGLIRCAVSTANEIGCDQFLAHVQVQNEPLFHRLRWKTLGFEDHHGLTHAKMQADLDAYPAGLDALPPVLAAQ